jgi:hypothetical protein
MPPNQPQIGVQRLQEPEAPALRANISLNTRIYSILRPGGYPCQTACGLKTSGRIVDSRMHKAIAVYPDATYVKLPVIV